MTSNVNNSATNRMLKYKLKIITLHCTIKKGGITGTKIAVK